MEINTEASMRAVECVSAFFIIGLVGYFLAKLRWFTDESAALLTRLLTGVIIPVNLFYNINASTTTEHFLPIMHYMLIPAAAILVTLFLTHLLTRRLPMEKSHRNIVVIASACSNTINIGLPVNLALFGTESLPAVLLYFMGNAVVFWTICNYLLAGDAPGAVRPPILSRTAVKRIFSPPIWGFLAGLLLLALDVKIPPFMGIAGHQLAGMTTPLSIICIGIAIFQTGLGNIRPTRDVWIIVFGRFVLSPLVICGLIYLFPVPEMMRNVFIIQSSLPPMANIALLAMKYKSDAGFASIAVSFGTLCALVTVPAFMIILTA